MRVVEMDKRRVAQVVATFAGGAPGLGMEGEDDGVPEDRSSSANGAGEAGGLRPR